MPANTSSLRFALSEAFRYHAEQHRHNQRAAVPAYAAIATRPSANDPGQQQKVSAFQQQPLFGLSVDCSAAGLHTIAASLQSRRFHSFLTFLTFAVDHGPQQARTLLVKMLDG